MYKNMKGLTNDDNLSETENGLWKEPFVLLAVVFGVYFLTLRFIFPGYFNPTTPFHSDFYMFYSASSNETLSTLFMLPRFVGMFVRDIVGIFGMKGTIVFLIMLNAVNITLTILLIKAAAKIKLYWPAVVLYLFLIFSHPGFYIKYSYDFFDAIAYCFAVSAMYFWYKNRENIKYKQLSVITLFVFLSLFAKETYFVPLCIFWCFQYFFANKKQRQSAGIMLGATIALFALSIVHSHLVNSAWVNIGGGKHDSYFIDMHPSSIIGMYVYYLKMWGNIGVAGLVALSLLISLVSKEHLKEKLLFLIVGLSTYIPYSLLPNHKFACYFWLAVPLSYGVILFINPDPVKSMIKKLGSNDGKLLKHILVAFIVVTVFFSILAFKQFNDSYKDPGLQWTLMQENINRNMLANFPFIKDAIAPSDKVLLTGLTFPFHPFVNPNYIDTYFGNSQNVKWVVAIYDKPNEDTSIGSIEFLGVGKIDVSKYDKIFAFDAEGKLVRKTEKNRIEANDTDPNSISENELILYPELNKYTVDFLKNNDWNSYMIIGNTLAGAYPNRGEYFLNKAIQFSKETNSYPYYYMGKVLEKLNRNEDALYNYNKAVELDKSKNKDFLSAVKKISK